MLSDKGETTNLSEKNPDVVKRLRAKLQAQIENGRTTVGSAQKNDGKIVVDKWDKPAKKGKK